MTMPRQTHVHGTPDRRTSATLNPKKQQRRLHSTFQKVMTFSENLDPPQRTQTQLHPNRRAKSQTTSLKQSNGILTAIPHPHVSRETVRESIAWKLPEKTVLDKPQDGFRPIYPPSQLLGLACFITYRKLHNAFPCSHKRRGQFNLDVEPIRGEIGIVEDFPPPHLVTGLRRGHWSEKSQTCCPTVIMSSGWKSLDIRT